MVLEAHARPLDVCLVVCEELPDAACGERASDFREAQDFCHHEHHYQAAVGIDGEVAGLRILQSGSGFEHQTTSVAIVISADWAGPTGFA